jgi:hypothetical protein
MQTFDNKRFDLKALKEDKDREEFNKIWEI